MRQWLERHSVAALRRVLAYDIVGHFPLRDPLLEEGRRPFHYCVIDTGAARISSRSASSLQALA